MIHQQLLQLLVDYEEQCPPTARERVDSLGNRELDTTIETGTGSTPLVYYRLYKFFQEHTQHNTEGQSEKYLKYAQEALKTNLEILTAYEEQNKTKKQKKVSFLASGAGLYTLGALLNHQTGQKEEVQRHIEKVFEYYDLCFTDGIEYELLHGLAGYLYCLLTLQKNIEGLDLKEKIVAIISKLYLVGISEQGVL